MTCSPARLTGRRAVATLVDDALVAAPLGVLLLVNLAAARSGRMPLIALDRNVRWWVPCCVTLPAALVLGAAEHAGGSPGKRVLGLRLRRSERPGAATWGWAVVRSLVKTALPWELGHQSVWQLRSGQDLSGGVLAASAYALLLGQVAGAALGDGRTYADHLAGTVVSDERHPHG